MSDENSAVKHVFSNKWLSFIIALLYVGLGTVYALSYWTGILSTLNEAIANFLFYFFLPVSFMTIGIIFTEHEPILPVFIWQIISFFGIWILVYSQLCLFRTTKRKKNEKVG